MKYHTRAHHETHHVAHAFGGFPRSRESFQVSPPSPAPRPPSLYCGTSTKHKQSTHTTPNDKLLQTHSVKKKNSADRLRINETTKPSTKKDRPHNFLPPLKKRRNPTPTDHRTHKLKHVSEVGDSVKVESLRSLLRIPHDAESELRVQPAGRHGVSRDEVKPHLVPPGIGEQRNRRLHSGGMGDG